MKRYHMDDIDATDAVLVRLKRGEVGAIPSNAGYLAIASSPRGIRKLHRAKGWSVKAPNADRKTVAIVQDVSQIVQASGLAARQVGILVTLLAEARIPCFVLTALPRRSTSAESAIVQEFVAPVGQLASVWNLGNLASALAYHALADGMQIYCTTAHVSRQPTQTAPRFKTFYPHRFSSLSPDFAAAMDFVIESESTGGESKDGKLASVVDLCNEAPSLLFNGLHGRRIARLLKSRRREL